MLFRKKGTLKHSRYWLGICTQRLLSLDFKDQVQYNK